MVVLYMDTEEPIIQPQEIVTVPKKPRTQAQLAALDAARKKAYAMRAEKSALKKQDEASVAMEKVSNGKSIEAQKVMQQPKIEESEEEEPPEVIYRKKAKKKKRVVVVQEESSSDSEIEVRLPKAKPSAAGAKLKNPEEVRYEKAYNSLFSIDTV